MKKYIDNKNLNNKCEKHNHKYRLFCLDCKCHLCKECILSKIHKTHNKVILGEEQPNKEDIKLINDKIKYYNNKIQNIKENQIKELKIELNKKKIMEKNRIKKVIKLNKIRNLKELKINEDKYINDINEIKRKYENEIKLRKIKYEKEINNINNKYKIIYNKEIIMNKNKIKELDSLYKSIKINNKEMNDILNIKKLNEIIINTYNKCNNNYYYCINMNNIINSYKKEKEIIDNNDKKINMININKDNNKKLEIIKEVKEEGNKIIINNKDKKNENSKNCAKKEYNNYITAEINIKEEDVNKKIRIINSFEEFIKNEEIVFIEEKDYYKYENEKEIKDNCKIKINNNYIDFNYYYEFKEKGKYIIKYIFTNNIIKADFMFSGCETLENINLSYFNSKNVNNMSYMFYKCKSLSNINLSNLNNQNVTNMRGIFYGCSSLTNINLSNFNTQNVTYMSDMFNECNSLEKLILTNFDTKNVTDMSNMFSQCFSLINI